MKLSLIGGKHINCYTIAGDLWKSIRKVSGVEFSFSVEVLATEKSFHHFWAHFVNERDFVGFNVAAPWKKSFAGFPQIKFQQEPGIDSVNVLYKNHDNIYANNTDISSIYRSISKYGPIDKKTVLVLGAGGVGAPTAKLLVKRGAKEVSVFDIAKSQLSIENVNVIKSFADIGKKQYDVIINATPQGRLFLDGRPDRFSMPISIKIFQNCIKSSSVYVELNYFPIETEMISLSRNCDLRIVTGVEILVLQAIESFEYYTGFKFSKDQTDSLVSYMTEISESREALLLKSYS